MANSSKEAINLTLKLNKLLDRLPRFCIDYFNSLEFTKQPKTKIAYATDLIVFFEFLIKNERSNIKSSSIISLTLNDLNAITSDDISDFLRYLKAYEVNGKIKTNGEQSIKRKLCTLRGLFSYYYKFEKIKNNPSIKIDMPKIHEMAIVRLEPNEVATLLDNIDSGNLLTDTQLKFHKKLKTRDLALLTLLLGTGIRVSECVGLNLLDVDFENARIKVIRKGGNESFVYFGDEVAETLLKYFDERKNIYPLSGHEEALFLSQQKKRLTARSIQKLVVKYASLVTNVKHITPHKLRSTYGTALYQETGDIYLVADVLGHKDVNTTRKHYADIVDENKRNARNIVKLRK